MAKIDYGMIIFYGTLNQVDIEKLNQIQYRCAKVVTGALHFTSRIKLEQDLGWESLSARNEFLGLSMFYKIAHNSVRPLIRTFLPKPVVKNYNTRSNDEYVNFPRPNEKFYKSFFPHFTRSWNNLSKELRNTLDPAEYKEKLKILLKPQKIRHYKYGNKYANTLHCRLRVGRSILNADSFSIGHSDTDLCNCGLKETVSHFFICPLYQEQQQMLNDKLNNLLPSFKNLSNAKKNEIYLFGYNLNSEEFDCRNITINYAVQRYISSTKRFQ